MDRYLRQFIMDIVKNLDPEIIDFFEQKKDVWDFPYKEIEKVVDETLEEYFELKTKREDLVPIMSTIKRSRLKKKSRWYTNYMNDVEVLNEMDMHNPLYFVIENAKNMPPAAYRKLYGDKTIEEIAADEIEHVIEWKKNSKSWLISFPGLSRLLKDNVYIHLKNDIIINAWQYIDKNLNGSIDNFMNKYPEQLIDKPIFSPTSFKIKGQQEGDELKDIVVDEENNQLLELVIKQYAPDMPTKKVMDEIDMKILNVMLNHVENSFYTDKTVVIDMATLIRNVTNSKPSMDSYSNMTERLMKFVDYSYSAQSKNEKVAFNFFDNVLVKKDEITQSTTVYCTFGDMLHDAVVKEKLVSVTINSANALESKLSKIILYAIQKTRIVSLQGNETVGKYSYTFFQKISRLGGKNKEKNLKDIKSALDEFVRNGIAIESYTYKNNIFYLNFIPLSEAEQEDLNLANRTMIEQNESIKKEL